MTERCVGVDVGGTKVSVAVLCDGVLEAARTEPTETSGSEALLKQIARLIHAAGADGPVGVAVPSVVEFATGRVRTSVNIPLRDMPLRELLRERLGVPVFVDNDATCAALAEAHDAAGALVARHLVMFTVGTGVGGGIVTDGRAYRGATGAAAELGHWIVAGALEHHPFPRTERFPQPGALETLASGSALDDLVAPLGFADGRAAVQAARDGDEAARAAVALLGHRLGIGIANAINMLDPELVVVGGGVSAAGELLLGPARETAAAYALTGAAMTTEIRIARHGSDAGVRGAALLAGQEAAREAEQGISA